MSERAPLCVDCVEALTDIDALEQAWAALEAATPEATGFQSFRWCRAWLATQTALRARIVAVREGDRLVMLYPLQIERRFGFSIACWIGEPMTQYGDALAEAGAGRARWRRAAEDHMAQWRDVDLLALTRLRAFGVLAPGASAGEALAAPYVDLRAGAPLLPKSVARRAKRLEAMGHVALHEAETPWERERLTRLAFALKRAWLRQRGVFSVGLSSSGGEDFLVRLARDGFLRACVLTVSGEPAAIDLGFVGGGAYRSFLGCYDSRFAAGSPGQCLTGRMIARCAAQGLAAYDLLVPSDPFKLAWASGEMAVAADYRPLSVKGRAAAFALATLRPLAKRVVHGCGRLQARYAFSFPRVATRPAPSRREETAL